ncbi:MAG: hypothetical protein LLG14_16565 [Nocardiaceae bacterium]|nr:hypothetical protein [Nocardiaceae bacterium]
MTYDTVIGLVAVADAVTVKVMMVVAELPSTTDAFEIRKVGTAAEATGTEPNVAIKTPDRTESVLRARRTIP